MEEQQRKTNPDLVKAERARQDQAGIKAIAFSDAQKAQWEKGARDAGWAEVEKAAPGQSKELRRLLAGD